MLNEEYNKEITPEFISSFKEIQESLNVVIQNEIMFYLNDVYYIYKGTHTFKGIDIVSIDGKPEFVLNGELKIDNLKQESIFNEKYQEVISSDEFIFFMELINKEEINNAFKYIIKKTTKGFVKKIREMNLTILSPSSLSFINSEDEIIIDDIFLLIKGDELIGYCKNAIGGVDHTNEYNLYLIASSEKLFLKDEYKDIFDKEYLTEDIYIHNEETSYIVKGYDNSLVLGLEIDIIDRDSIKLDDEILDNIRKDIRAAKDINEININKYIDQKEKEKGARASILDQLF